MSDLIDWLKPTQDGVLGLKQGMSEGDLQAAMGKGSEQKFSGNLRRWNYTWSGNGAVMGDVACIIRGGSLTEVLIEVSAYRHTPVAEAFNTIAAQLDTLTDSEGPQGKWEEAQRGQKFTPKKREWTLDGVWKLTMGQDVLNEGMPIIVELTVNWANG